MQAPACFGPVIPRNVLAQLVKAGLHPWSPGFLRENRYVPSSALFQGQGWMRQGPLSRPAGGCGSGTQEFIAANKQNYVADLSRVAR